MLRDNEMLKSKHIPTRAKVKLKKKLGVWVYQGEAAEDSIPDLIEREHEERLHEILEPSRAAKELRKYLVNN